MAPLKYLAAPTERRPWGGFRDLFEAQGFKVKLIEIAPGQRISLQRHRLRDEAWIAVEGRGLIKSGNCEEEPVIPFCHANIPRERIHRITNTGDAPLLILELQRGECREDDIERLEDDYGRVGK